MGLGLGFGLENKEDQSTLSTVNYMIAVCDFIHLIATRTVSEHGLIITANLMCDAGWNEAPIGHQVHHDRIPHIPANKNVFCLCT